MQLVAKLQVLSSCCLCFISERQRATSGFMADEMVMIAEPFLQVCLIINSIMDSLFAWSPIRKSQPTGAQQTSGLIDTPVHAGTWKEA